LRLCGPWRSQQQQVFALRQRLFDRWPQSWVRGKACLVQKDPHGPQPVPGPGDAAERLLQRDCQLGIGSVAIGNETSVSRRVHRKCAPDWLTTERTCGNSKAFLRCSMCIAWYEPDVEQASRGIGKLRTAR